MAKKDSSFVHGLKLTWWQVGFFKLSTIAFGILLGLYFPAFFAEIIWLVWAACIGAGLYIAYIYFNN